MSDLNSILISMGCGLILARTSRNQKEKRSANKNKFEARNSKQIQNSNLKIQNKSKPAPERWFLFFCFGHLFFGHLGLFRISNFGFRIFQILPKNVRISLVNNY
jgi:hypothetical protein